jgi:hypothetical protein
MKDFYDHFNWQTVVLTPGFWCLPDALAIIGNELKDKFNVVYSPSFHRLNTVSIHISAKELAEKLAFILRYTRDWNINLVGHSMWWLISIKALEMSVNLHIHNIITLGTPYSGTPVANLCSPVLKVCKEINTPKWYLHNVCIWDQINGKLIAHISGSDLIVPAGSQIPQKTIAPKKTKIVRHESYDHGSFLIGEWCKQIVQSIKKYCSF